MSNYEQAKNVYKVYRLLGVEKEARAGRIPFIGYDSQAEGMSE
jgi:hypothetical protein